MVPKAPAHPTHETRTPSSEQCGAVHFGTVRCRCVEYDMTPHITVRYHTEGYRTIQKRALQNGTQSLLSRDVTHVCIAHLSTMSGCWSVLFCTRPGTTQAQVHSGPGTTQAQARFGSRHNPSPGTTQVEEDFRKNTKVQGLDSRHTSGAVLISTQT